MKITGSVLDEIEREARAEIAKGTHQGILAPIDILALVDHIRERQDKVDGLECDLDSAVEVAFNHGAIDWVRNNYPKQYARLK